MTQTTQFNHALAVAIVGLLATLTSRGSSFAEDRTDYFVFLTTGKSTQDVAKEEIQKKQIAHIDNFTRLAKLGSLTAAGPCADPTKVVRGIVVIHANSIEQANVMFGPDPYVSEGFMNAEMHPYRVLAGQILLDLDSNAMEQYVILIMKPGKPSDSIKTTKSLESDVEAFAKEFHSNKKVAFAAWFGEKNAKTDRLGVMIFRGKDLETVRQSMQSQAFVSDGRIAFDVFAQYLAKKAFPEP